MDLLHVGLLETNEIVAVLFCFLKAGAIHEVEQLRWGLVSGSIIIPMRILLVSLPL